MPAATVFYVGTPAEVAHHAAPLLDKLPIEIADCDEVRERAKAADCCIFYNEYFDRFRQLCLEVQGRGCATLYAIDGILEWRNSWEFPLGHSCRWTMRPVLSHKVACIGASQARVLESWGNLGKCEVVGVPRFDTLEGRRPRARPPDAPFELLIVTAKNPGYTDEQREITRQSLADLKAWLDRHQHVGGIPLRPRWRVTAGLEYQLGVQNELVDTRGIDLATALSQADAMITTPSTAMLEGMLHGLPVALLDYHNCPHYVPAAWTVSAPQHVDQVLPELVEPPEAKLLYQETLLHDALECRTPASPRMVQLIEGMLESAGKSRDQGSALSFPGAMLPDRAACHHPPEERFSLTALYPDHLVFKDPDLTRLQAEVANARDLNRAFRQDLEAIKSKQAAENRGVLRGALQRLIRLGR